MKTESSKSNPIKSRKLIPIMISSMTKSHYHFIMAASIILISSSMSSDICKISLLSITLTSHISLQIILCKSQNNWIVQPKIIPHRRNIKYQSPKALTGKIEVNIIICSRNSFCVFFGQYNICCSMKQKAAECRTKWGWEFFFRTSRNVKRRSNKRVG